MDPLILGATSGGALLSLALFTGRLKRYWIWALVAALISILVGLYIKSISLAAPLSGYSPDNLWLIIAWIEFAHLISISGLKPKGNLGLLAFLGGAFISDIGTAALIAPFAGSAKNRGRVALTASAGAMLTTGGTPATLLFGNAQIHPLFAVALALIVWPKGYTTRDVRSPMKQSTSDTSKHKWILLSCLLAYFLVQVGIPHFWAISGLDIILILLIGPKTVTTPWRKELYLLAIATLLAVAVSTGATHQFQLACNALVNMFGGFGAGGVALLAGLFSSLGGEGAASLVLAQSFQEVSYGPSTVLQQAAVMGLAIGGLGPLIAARAFRSSLRLFAFQFVLMVVLVLTFGV